MSNVAYLDPHRLLARDEGAPGGGAALPALGRAEDLCASAKDALAQLAEHFELAIRHARVVEEQIADPGRRLAFARRIAFTECLLGAAQSRILQL